MDTGLDENEAELGVLVLLVAVEVLADGDGLVSGVLVSATMHGAARARGNDSRSLITFLMSM